MHKSVGCFLAIVLLSAFGMLPFRAVDVTRLKPIEVLILQYDKGIYTISTDDGLLGSGNDVEQALFDLCLTTPGEVFLDTVNYLLVEKDCINAVEQLFSDLRPACLLYIIEGEVTNLPVSDYLESHPSSVTLLSYRQQDKEIPCLIVEGEVCRLVNG